MNNEHYDEYQTIIRLKISFQTLMITFALIFINGFVKAEYLWAEPMAEAAILLYIPTLYFVTVSLFKNAFISVKEKSEFSRIIFYSALGILSLFALLLQSTKRDYVIITEGQLQSSAISLIMAIFFIYIAIIMLIKKYLNRQNKELDN